MAGDGVSLQTTLVQLGHVAKTQAKGQHSPQATTPFSEQVAKEDELKVQRVKQTEQAVQQRVDPDAERDRRRRRRLRRVARKRARTDDDPAPEEEAAEEEKPAVGSLVDTRA
jgi:hypothetical protein